MIWLVQPGKGYSLILLVGTSANTNLLAGGSGQINTTTAATVPVGYSNGSFNNSSPGTFTSFFTGDASVTVSSNISNKNNGDKTLIMYIYNHTTTIETPLMTQFVPNSVTATYTNTVTYTFTSGVDYHFRGVSTTGTNGDLILNGPRADTYWKIYN